MADYGLDPQAALDQPRFCLQGRTVDKWTRLRLQRLDVGLANESVPRWLRFLNQLGVLNFQTAQYFKKKMIWDIFRPFCGPKLRYIFCMMAEVHRLEISTS